MSILGRFSKFIVFLLFIGLISGCGLGNSGGGAGRSIQNVSYDPTRELYEAVNKEFQSHWLKTKGEQLEINQSHGGSGSQSRSVLEGSPADVVTLALGYDIDVLSAERKLLAENWQSKLPNNSSPYTSTIVFLVRKGNPKNIKDWDDLVKDGIQIVTPNPQTSGGARWNYLAAWGFALKRELGDLSALNDPARAEDVAKAQRKAQEFVGEMLSSKHITSMEAGARGATNKFARNGQGDVLLAWENEALLYTSRKDGEQFEVVVPSLSILTEPPVAVVESVVDSRGTRDVAQAYLEFLYTPVAQEIIAKNYYRPCDKDVAKKYVDQFPKLELFTIDQVFGGWKKAQAEHFGKGGTYDQIIEQHGGQKL